MQSHIPGLFYAYLKTGNTEVAKFENMPIPRAFEAWFIFMTDFEEKAWSSVFTVRISPEGTPKLLKVLTSGSMPVTESENQIPFWLSVPFYAIEDHYIEEIEPVQRWQLKHIEQFRFQLYELSLRLAYMTLVPGEVGQVEENKALWEVVDKSFTTNEIKSITKIINTRIRQKITLDFLRQVAEIYTEAALAGEKPIKAIQERFKCSHRTASDYASRARDEKFLPDTDPGIVTVRKPKKKKGK